jgi:tetratricopeptide (TPR) repeat protein
LPEEPYGIWKAQAALVGGEPDLALSALSSTAESRWSDFYVVLSQIVKGTTEKEFPQTDEDTRALPTWLQLNPGHPNATEVAARLMEAKTAIPIADLLFNERTPPNGAWAPAGVGDDGDESWPKAVAAVLPSKEATWKDRTTAYIALAEQTTDNILKAGFLSIAARFAEQDGDSREQALELYLRAQELDPDQPTPQTGAIRLMRTLGAWQELADQLAEGIQADSDGVHAQTALHERAMILEHRLKDLGGAGETLAELTERDSEDVAANWSDIRLAFRFGDWQRVIRGLTKLGTLCLDEAHLFSLMRGEVYLFAVGNYDRALHAFEHAALSRDDVIAQSARLYSFFVLYQLGDTGALVQALEEEHGKAAEGTKEMWLPELLEIGRAERGTEEIFDLLVQPGEPDAYHLFWQLIAGGDRPGSSAVSQPMRRLANSAPRGDIAGSCRAAAALYQDVSPLSDEAFHMSDLESPQALWHVADRIGAEDDPVTRAQIYQKRAEMAEEHDDLEWIDWMQLCADAKEEAGDTEGALAALDLALERSPGHLGLLGTKTHLLFNAGKYAECVDAYRSQANSFFDKNEKASCLAKAADILGAKLDDKDTAEKFCQEALNIVPGHAETNTVLIWIYRSKGDDESIARLFKERIDGEEDAGALVALYQEQADQFFASDDFEGALRALDNLLELAPDGCPAYLTKIEILDTLERWEDAVETMRLYMLKTDDPVEVRNMSWRASHVISEQLGDVKTAMSWLEQLITGGDRHPETERKLIALAKKAGNFELAADALSRLAGLLNDETEQIQAMLDEAKIRLEKLFDDDRADEIVNEILAVRPAHLPTLKFYAQFGEQDRVSSALGVGIDVVRDLVNVNPIDLNLVNKLRLLAKLRGEEDLLFLCDDVITLLSGDDAEPWPGDLVPSSELDSEMLRHFFVHPNEISTAARMTEMVGAVSGEVYANREHIPRVSKETRIALKSGDPVVRWVHAWAGLLGYKKAQVHRTGEDFSGVVALPDSVPAVGINPSVTSPLSAKHRFFLARNIWRSARGFSVFEEGDVSGPCQWVVAVAAAIVGERIELPLPTDADIVSGVKKAMPRRLRRGLADPSHLLLQEDRRSLRAWATAISYSADRFGLLAATRLVEVIPLIIEEVAGSSGLKKYRENPRDTLTKVPRCMEILRFALSKKYLDARRKVGLTVRNGGAGR